MKILAIRGCNLASLAGEFEIDLAHGPLGAAGVFAIVGPTGAGKSTLLDAMCVALFDRTPRLTNHSRVVVGRGDDDPTALGAQDVRSLLRRGASQGWAEVDFESGDARRYRARWSVRRARGATDGRFQNQQVTLTALDASGTGVEQLGGTKTETLEAIHARLGLTFDQFRRSALLAQGEFAAFLRADGKDRSELLERMTGTEIYSQLSIAAHQRAAVAMASLRERQGAALAIPVLAEDERAKAEDDLALAKDAQTASRARFTAAEAVARWQQEATRRADALAAADTARRAADTAVESAAAERAELALRRRAEALRGPWDDVTRLDRAHSLAVSAAAAAADAAESAAAQQRALEGTRADLTALHAPIRDARIAAGLPESSARSKSTGARGRASAVHAGTAADRSASLASAATAADRSPHLASAGTTADRSPNLASAGSTGDRSARLASTGTVGDRSARLATTGTVGDRSSDVAAAGTGGGTPNLVERASAASGSAEWLLVRRALAPSVTAWAELDAQLGAVAALSAEIAASDKILDERARSRAQHVKRRETAVAAHQGAQQRLIEAQTAAASFQQRRGISLDAARRAEDDARRRCTDLERLGAITAEARAASTARDEFARQLTELTVATTADTAHRIVAESDRDAATTLRAERTRMLDELRKAAGYAHARTELVDGDPCPLCGATEHPWHNRGAFDALIADAKSRLDESSSAFDRAVAALAALDARAAQRAVEHARLVACQATTDKTLAASQRTWREALASLGELLFVDDPASSAAKALADERLEAAKAKLEAARAARSGAEAAAKAANEAQANVQARQADVEQHVHALREVDAAIASVDAAAERLRGEREGKLDRLAELLAAIDASLARWHTALVDGDAVRAVVELAREGLASRVAGGGFGAVGAVGASGALGAAGAGVAGAAGVVRAGGAGLAAHEAALLERTRRALGELVRTWQSHASIVAELDAELAAAIAGADVAARDAERLATEHAAHHDAARTRVSAAADELAAAMTTLDAARIAAGFDRDELRLLLAGSAARVDELAARLDALDRAADRARTLVMERQRLVDDHAAASPLRALSERHSHADGRADTRSDATNATGVDAANLLADAARLSELAAAVTAADHHAAALAATLAADADARARRAAALADYAAAEQAAEVDRVLGDVIGSHDGKLFRSFAQSLTLDSLLAVANSHLEELAPRYQLERVPKHDLELQVIDRDLGNEIRSVQSLSGGESFLVSLALALGLSSMSAHDVRVRTLLIDEGFGTLDPATLDSALAVLDALQATGRQVGVISHVPALLERVGAHVRVYPRGGGRSEVIVAD